MGGEDRIIGDEATSVAVDSSGTIAITGHFDFESQDFGTEPLTSKGARDVFVVKVRP